LIVEPGEKSGKRGNIRSDGKKRGWDTAPITVLVRPRLTGLRLNSYVSGEAVLTNEDTFSRTSASTSFSISCTILEMRAFGN
jgi:hypothetical protein